MIVTIRCSAPIRHLDLAHLADTVVLLDAGGIDEYLIEFSDGDFVAPFTGMEALIPTVAAISKTPLHALLYTNDPDRHIKRLAHTGCQRITVFAESGNHLHRTIGNIRELGASPGVAVLPATSLTTLSYLLPFVDRVVMQAVDPCIGDAPPFKTAGERVRILRENIRYREYRCEIAVAGAMDLTHAARLAHFGAESVVLDDTFFFADGTTLADDSVETFKNAVLVGTKLV